VSTERIQKSAIRDTAIWKSGTRLSDGREIFYYDETPDTGRADVPDRRGLPYGTWQPPEIRWDPLAGENVVIAAQRQDRTFLPPADQCPLDPSRYSSHGDHITEIPASSYDVVVFENRFPSLRRPHGRCEVVCFTSVHEASFAQLTPRRVRTVMEAWIDRTVTLGAFPEVEQVYCFENRGEEIGVTLHHPHGQIYAFPFITPKTARMLDQAKTYTSKGNLFDIIVEQELDSQKRVIGINDHWVAFVPQAARWPFEVRIFPLTRTRDLPALDDQQRDAFGPIYLDVLKRLDGLFGKPAPYIAAWHQAPSKDLAAREVFGAHLQVFSVRRAAGKLKYLAGAESGMGVWVNDIVPEEAARRLREVEIA
jgi:UDPglucose--hexose-1-phosphate uridylyltransferase